MSIQHDPQQQVTQGWVYCRPPEKSDFSKCFLVLDRPKQLLICYNRPKSAGSIQDRQCAHHDNWPVLTQLRTDSISLVDEAVKVKKQYCFAIHSLAKQTHIAAESWKDMEEWIECIKEASRISVDKSCLNPNRMSLVGSYTTEVVGGNVIHTPVQPSVEDIATPSKVCESREGSISSGCSERHPSDNQIIRSGFCVKQGAMMKNWKRRYLTLTNDELTYSKNEFSVKPLKRIPVQDIKDVKVSNSELSETRSNLIDLVTTDRTFYMQFDSVDEMYSWVEDLRKACDLPIMTYL